MESDEVLNEWRTSIDILEEIIQDKVVCAAVPFGIISEKVRLSAQRAGIRYLFSSDTKFTAKITEPFNILGRVSIRKNTSLQEINKLVHFKGLKKLEMIFRLKKAVKNALKFLNQRQ